MGWAYKTEGQTTQYGQQTSIQVTGVHIDPGDLVVVFLSSLSSVAQPTDVSDDESNSYTDLAVLSVAGGVLMASYAIATSGDGAVTITGTFTNSGTNVRTNIKVVVFTPDGSETQSLDFYVSRTISSWTNPPWATSSDDTTGDDVVCVASCVTTRGTTDHEIDSVAATLLTSPTSEHTTWYRILSAQTDGVDAELNAAGGVSSLVMYMLAFKSVSAAGPQTISPSSISSGEAIGSAKVNFSLLAAGAIATAEAFGTAILNFILKMAGLSSEEAHGSPQLNMSMSGVGAIASEEAHGTPSLAMRILASAIASLEAFGETVIIGGAVPTSVDSSLSLSISTIIR